jgi:hypothetical protein
MQHLKKKAERNKCPQFSIPTTTTTTNDPGWAKANTGKYYKQTKL